MPVYLTVTTLTVPISVYITFGTSHVCSLGICLRTYIFLCCKFRYLFLARCYRTYVLSDPSLLVLNRVDTLNDLFLVLRPSPGAVAKYCDERMCVSVCLCVCLSTTISQETHARSLPIFVHVAYGRGLVPVHQNDEIPREGAILGDHEPDKPNTRVNCELDWSMQQLAHDRSRCLTASVGRIYCRPRRGGGLHNVGLV